MYFKGFKIIITASLMCLVGSSALGQDLTLAQLKEEFTKFQQTLPMMVDGSTRLDRVEAAVGEAIYFFTIVNSTYDQLDWGTVEANIRQNAITNYCTSPDMTYFRNGGIGMLYIYSDKNGEITGTVKIPKTSCDE